MEGSTTLNDRMADLGELEREVMQMVWDGGEVTADAIRARLDHALARVPRAGTLVLTSEDGVLARLALREAVSLARGEVQALAGGNDAWVASGGALVPGEENMADAPLDLWLKAYERSRGVKEAMEEYLRWEIELLDRIAQDGTCRFTA